MTDLKSSSCQLCASNQRGKCLKVTGNNDIIYAHALCEGRFFVRYPQNSLSSPGYFGLDDADSLNEWTNDHFENESHYVGFEVGDQ